MNNKKSNKRNINKSTQKALPKSQVKRSSKEVTKSKATSKSVPKSKATTKSVKPYSKLPTNKVKKDSHADKNSKIISLNKEFNTQNLIQTKKLKITFIIIIILIIALILRIGFLQFVQGSFLKESAYKNQSINQILSPKRGNIYDSNGRPLAISARVDTVTINPSKIKYEKDEEKTKELKEKLSKGFSEIFELEYDDVFKKVNSNSQFQTIAKKVEQDKIDKLKEWLSENDIPTEGINIDEDTKRYYPNENVLSAVLGFCGTDNQGITGIESKWDDVLTGTPGKIVSSKGGDQQEIPDSEETYIAAENGSDLTLTIDLKVQTIVEKYLKEAVDYNNCENGGNVIVMNPKNGDILAMASYPNYNLNTPFTPNEKLAETYESLTDEQKSAEIQNMWKNKSVSELYDPGSTFKTITASVALEENITEPDVDGEFICTGSENINGTIIKCWADVPHGRQNLTEALGNSCNPAFMQLGKRITAPTLYKYYQAFGLMEKTGVALYGEENSIIKSLDSLTAVDAATLTFGQGLSITPMQMITAVCAIANDGYLMQPRIVKEIKNVDTGAVTEVDPVTVRQVISKETSEKVCSMMEYVATEGSGRRAAVAGYSIGGKTGTSELLGADKDKGYVASYVAISPVEDTQVVLLLTLYKPPVSNHQGGTLAGPVVSQMLSDILPYLNVPTTLTEQDSISTNSNLVMVPEIRNKTITEAKKKLEDLGFKTIVSSNADPNKELVTDQVPKPGVSLAKNSIVMLYSKDSVANLVAVPDLKGLGASQATETLKAKNLNISIDGKGVVMSQDYAKDTQVPEGTVISVTLKP